MTDKKSAQILSHPRWGQFFEPGSDDEMIFSSRMLWVDAVNKTILGAAFLSEQNKQTIRTLNELLVKYGWQPLHPDFENL